MIASCKTVINEKKKKGDYMIHGRYRICVNKIIITKFNQKSMKICLDCAFLSCINSTQPMTVITDKVYKCTRTAVTQSHTLGRLKNIRLFLRVLEGGSPRLRCWLIRFLLRPLSLAYRRSPSCCVLTWPFLCLCVYAYLVSLPLLIQDSCHTGLRPTHMTSFSCDYHFKGPISKYSHILRC